MSHTFLEQNRVLFKAASLLIIIMFLFSPVLPAKKVEAQLAVTCPVCESILSTISGWAGAISAVASSLIGEGVQALKLKEFVMDPIVKMIARTILRSITQSIIRWASSGFQGNPAFIQDPKRFFTSVADQAIGNIIYNNNHLKWMCTPFQFQLKKALLYNRSFSQRAQCTLTDVVKNYQGYISSINNELGNLGGWGAWNVMAVEPQNNPYGAYAMFNLQVDAAITGDKQRELNLLNWGNGFFSWKDPSCVTEANKNKELQSQMRDQGFVDENNTPYNNNATTSTDPNNCATFTPGSVIASQVNKTLGVGQDELVAADEIDEILGAVAYGLVLNVLGGNGLFGAGGGGGEDAGSNDYLAQMESEDRQNFTSSKNSAIEQVTIRIDDENRYTAAKNGSIARVQFSADKVSNVITCLASTTPNEIPSASAVLSQINSNKTALEKDVAISENNIKNLRLVIDRLNSLPYEQRGNLQLIMTQFSDLLSQTHHQGDVIQAQYERDFAIPDRLKDVDAQTDAKMQQCIITLQSQGGSIVPSSGGI